MLRKIVKDYFTFTKKERVGLLCMVFLIGLAYLLPIFFGNRRPLVLGQDALISKMIDTLASRSNGFSKGDRNTQVVVFQPEIIEDHSFKNGELFSFDPNSASGTDWQRLGLPPKTIKTLFNYRSKGGKFKRAEDLKKIWGLPDGFFERVKNYIVIAKKPDEQRIQYYSPPDEKKQYLPSTIEINSADTSAWASLPGIGPKLSARIVLFREKLGGFYAIEQVRETYALPDSTFQKIRSRLTIVPSVRQLNINTATKDELRQHPYIRWQLANAIVEYRDRHGSFNRIDQLKNIVAIDEATFNRIAPYLSL